VADVMEHMETKIEIAHIINNIGILDLYAFFRRWFTKSQVVIMMYHRVCPKKDNWSLASINPEVFEEQIQYFCRNYEILSLEELTGYIKQGKRLPEKAAAFTFDDGYLDNYQYAYPVLNKYHVPAVIFLTTGHISSDKLFWFDKVSYIIHHTNKSHLNLDELGEYSLQAGTENNISAKITEGLKQINEDRKNFLIDKLKVIADVDIPSGLGKELILSWNNVREMNSKDIIFGAHTVNHPILANMPLPLARWEIIQSKKDIEKEIGKEVNIFSYPNGRFRDYSPKIVDFIMESKFACAVSVSPQKLINSDANVYTLGRIGALQDFKMFKVELCGLWGDIKPIIKKRS